MPEQGTDKHGDFGDVKIDCEVTRRVVVTNDEGLAIAVETPKDRPLATRNSPSGLRLNPTTSNVQTVTAVASEYTLPNPGGKYILIATGGTVWIRETEAAVMNAAGMVCPDGVPIGDPHGHRLIGPTISCIAAAGGRYLYFVEVLD